ncbi:MAG: group II intron reverse transcriptase/maturase, partial [Alkalibacterium sp.]
MPLGKMTEMYRKSLIEFVVRKENLLTAAEAVRRNKGAAGVDGMTVWEVENHIEAYYLSLRQK